MSTMSPLCLHPEQPGGDEAFGDLYRCGHGVFDARARVLSDLRFVSDAPSVISSWTLFARSDSDLATYGHGGSVGAEALGTNVSTS